MHDFLVIYYFFVIRGYIIQYMARKRFLMTAMLFVALAAMAVPAKRGMKNIITLDDGTRVEATLVGDEFMHYWKDSLGNRYVPTAQDGVYKMADDNAIARLSVRAASRKGIANARRTVRRKANSAADVFKGKKKGLVILVEYTDVKFKDSDPQKLFDDIANKANYTSGSFCGSVKDYFLAQSRGQFELDFDVVGPVQLAHNMAYYGGNNSYGEDSAPEEMVVEGCKAIDSQVNFADYDWDGDGEVDQVYVIYAGYGEAENANMPNTVWPHEWQLSGTYNTLYLDGVKIDTYACSSELNGNGRVGGIGTMCHEFSHCMGIPDMYDTSYSGNFGMGPFDLMDYGSYNMDGYQPCGYTGYERAISGWISPVEIRKGDELEVSGMKALEDGGETYKLINSGNENEYFMVDNRQCSGWDEGLPASGVLITHVDYDPKVWNYNLVNTTGYSVYGYNNSHQRMTIFHADNDDDHSYFNSNYQAYIKTTYQGDPYPCLGNDSLTSLSQPSNAVYTANADGSKFMDVAIRNIAVAEDGTASMTFGPNASSSSSVVDPSGDVLFKETFDNCSGTGGNDAFFGGSASIAVSAFKPDNVGWYSAKSYGGSKCARFGNSSTVGTATTPSFTISGSAVLTFRAAPWGSDPTDLALSVSGNAKISPSSVTMSTGMFKEFTATITGSGTVKVTFTPSKRLFLDDVCVTSGSTEVDCISNLQTRHVVAIYSADGALRGNLLHGVNIVKYSDGSVRKVMGQ